MSYEPIELRMARTFAALRELRAKENAEMGRDSQEALREAARWHRVVEDRSGKRPGTGAYPW